MNFANQIVRILSSITDESKVIFSDPKTDYNYENIKLEEIRIEEINKNLQ